ncbi:hypothetical protein [Stieleria mannarensis]|uniref:hypothetical protein n=1 Tax=Stieleria mannarensis TaxID=2755585 RepID=UPI0016048D1A|nr:hypothetical protein [Rhodopirellula sp. JC639]
MKAKLPQLSLAGLLLIPVLFLVGYSIAEETTAPGELRVIAFLPDGKTPLGFTSGQVTVAKPTAPAVQIEFGGTDDQTGKLEIKIGNQPAVKKQADLDDEKRAIVSLADLDGVELVEGHYPIVFTYHPTGGNPSLPIAINVVIDTIGPVLRTVQSIEFGQKLEFTFADSDLDLSTVTSSRLLVQQKLAGQNPYSNPIGFTKKEHRDRKLILEFDPPLAQGEYQVSFAEDGSSHISDSVKNPIAAPETKATFIVSYPLADTPVITVVESAETRSRADRTGLWVTRSDDVRVSLPKTPLIPGGKMAARVNGQTQSRKDIASFLDVGLTREGNNTVQVVFFDGSGNSVGQSHQINILKDSIGPRLLHAEVIDVPDRTGTKKVLVATFDSNDLTLPGVVTARPMQIRSRDSANSFGTSITVDAPVRDGNDKLRLEIDQLLPGEYQLVVLGSGQTITDSAGNPAGNGQNQVVHFTIAAERNFGQHVEFPPYAPPKKQAIPDEGFNPGDYVETRVARLFYYRDAHRVAQIINRNIRSFNQAAVTQAERRAESAREDADAATDRRRQKEREASEAADQARAAEQQLAQAQQIVADNQQLTNSITADKAQRASLQTQLDALPADSSDPAVVAQRTVLINQIAILDNRVVQNQASLNQIGDVSEIAGRIPAMQQSVANLRERELSLRSEWNQAQAEEERAKQKQFRNEVTAAETDPDTYVAGDMHSVDPVTQCSISVIGEGLIQIRGPIKGINKIRTMINQIDSPVGQIKIGVFTVQVNGEDGAKMEKVVGDVESYVDLSRFLVNQSLNLLRKAIQSEAAMLAEQCQHEGHYQVDRDRRYLYSFFGRDFIDELYEMNSEFLFTENKVLSLHAMDTISLNRALFILALAKNDVRERIVARFLESAKSDLPDAEYDFRRSSELRPHKSQKHFPFWNRSRLPVTNHYKKEAEIYEAVHRNALQRYHFRNVNAFFDTGFTSPDTMNPMQREFIRLAQIFKARLVAEIELKQRVMERGMIEDRSNTDEYKFELFQPIFQASLQLQAEIQEQRVDAFRKNVATAEQIHEAVAEAIEMSRLFQKMVEQAREIWGAASNEFAGLDDNYTSTEIETNKDVAKAFVDTMRQELLPTFQSYLPQLNDLKNRTSLTKSARQVIDELGMELSKAITAIESLPAGSEAWTKQSGRQQVEQVKRSLTGPLDEINRRLYPSSETDRINDLAVATLNDDYTRWLEVEQLFLKYQAAAEDPSTAADVVSSVYHQLTLLLKELEGSQHSQKIIGLVTSSYRSLMNTRSYPARLKFVEQLQKETRVDLDHRKLLNYMIDEQEDKFIELVEGTRSHIAVIDQYLKRLSIALEDDFKIQFYDPAFVRIREAARGLPVTLSQVERTTILTNNRDFAKVDPQATMEFDLPKRQIAIKEAFDAAKALVEDTGALINDPTFLSAFQMMGGSTQPATVKNLVPGQSMSTDQHIMGLVPPQPPQNTPGSALQSLVPEPSIFKLETGTGFQIRPVMQPDGDSAVYDFDYMYTTNIREPVRADEKHIGRVRRHFVHTAVQTGNFELREISRYQVALKVSRTSKGVPLLEDIPVVGVVFRPAPSDDSSLQQNVIFGQTNLYPTLFDLMGLRWAQQVVDLDHLSLIESEHVIRGRQKAMRDFVFGQASERVDDFLDVRNKSARNFRPDLYHEQTMTSPYHPRGYTLANPATDPTGNNYERHDRRPPEMQDPPYDRYRHRPVHPEQIGPGVIPEPIPPRRDDSLLPAPLTPPIEPSGGPVDSEFESLLRRERGVQPDLGQLGRTSGSIQLARPVAVVRHLPSTTDQISTPVQRNSVIQAGFQASADRSNASTSKWNSFGRPAMHQMNSTLGDN